MAVNNDVLRLVQRIAAAFVNDRVAVAGANDAAGSHNHVIAENDGNAFFFFGQNGYISVKKTIAADNNPASVIEMKKHAARFGPAALLFKTIAVSEHLQPRILKILRKTDPDQIVVSVNDDVKPGDLFRQFPFFSVFDDYQAVVFSRDRQSHGLHSFNSSKTRVQTTAVRAECRRPATNPCPDHKLYE